MRLQFKVRGQSNRERKELHSVVLSWSSKPRFQLGVKFNACREKKQPEENKKWEWRQQDFLHSSIITNEEDGENQMTEEELETTEEKRHSLKYLSEWGYWLYVTFNGHWKVKLILEMRDWGWSSFSSHHHHGHLHRHLLQFSVFVSIIKLVPSQSGYIRCRI